MQIGSNGEECARNTDCTSGQCYRYFCFDAKLSCSTTKSCAYGLTCSSGKCVCNCWRT